MTNYVPLGPMLLLFGIVLTLGFLFCVPLYRFDVGKLVRSKLFVKVLLWLPIFAVFLASLYIGDTGRLLLLVTLIVLGLRELQQNYQSGRTYLAWYGLAWAIALLYFYLLGLKVPGQIVQLLILIGFASVLSDVGAFFLGNYLGKHKLPAWLNNAKSWEGVAGQVLGALLGVVLVQKFVGVTLGLWLFVPIGIGAALGDLCNSYAKRRAGVKDWGNSLPGHGGLVDRLASLAGSALVTFYCLNFL